MLLIIELILRLSTYQFQLFYLLTITQRLVNSY